VTSVVRRVRHRAVAVITRHGLPAAVMLSIPERHSSARMHGRWY
jgi:prevent-host-death family protein